MMARIRSIKPEFWTNAQVLECSTNARLMFIGLWNFCDDAGRHTDSPKQIKAEIFPSDDFTNEQISWWLAELQSNSLIDLYTVENKGYLFVTGWHHQRIDKPQPAKYPDPFQDHSKIIPRAILPDTIGYDRKGKDKNDDYTSAKAPLISQEAFAVEREMGKIVGIDPDFIPPAWFGATHKIQAWLSGGWPAESIIASTRMQMAARNGKPPPSTANYFEKGIADFIANNARPISIGTTNAAASNSELSASGYNNGSSRGRRQTRDDAIIAGFSQLSAKMDRDRELREGVETVSTERPTTNDRG